MLRLGLPVSLCGLLFCTEASAASWQLASIARDGAHTTLTYVDVQTIRAKGKIRHFRSEQRFNNPDQAHDRLLASARANCETGQLVVTREAAYRGGRLLSLSSSARVIDAQEAPSALAWLVKRVCQASYLSPQVANTAAHSHAFFAAPNEPAVQLAIEVTPEVPGNGTMTATAMLDTKNQTVAAATAQ